MQQQQTVDVGLLLESCSCISFIKVLYMFNTVLVCDLPLDDSSSLAFSRKVSCVLAI
jgi:hypothetical protein